MGDRELNIKKQLASRGLKPKKAWGQNFLHDENVLQNIVSASGVSAHSRCIELGAGTGALTVELAKTGCCLTAVERDRDLVPILEDLLKEGGYENAHVLSADAARLDYRELMGFHEAKGKACPHNADECDEEKHDPQGAVVVGNLPYQISSRILVSVADAALLNPGLIQRGIFMVQREVAERCLAHPGGKVFGLLSVLLQRAFRVGVVCEVDASQFFPPPAVQSTVLCLEYRKPLYAVHFDKTVVTVARAAFAQKRKTIRNTLRAGFKAQLQDTRIEDVLEAAQVDPQVRAETLSVEKFYAIAQALSPFLS